MRLMQIINIQDIIRVPSIEEMKDMYVTSASYPVVYFGYLHLIVYSIYQYLCSMYGSFYIL